MNIAEEIRYMVERLRRLGRSRGFGIQSPSAYSFVTDVLCQRLPYHPYKELVQQYPDIRGKQLKFCRLLFRLANYQQAEKTYIDASFSEAHRTYLQTGNRRSQFVSEPKGCALVVISAEEGHLLLKSIEKLPDQAIIVLKNIYSKGLESDFWLKIKDLQKTSMTFDTYDYGIVVMGETAFQQHYLVNL